MIQHFRISISTVHVQHYIHQFLHVAILVTPFQSAIPPYLHENTPCSAQAPKLHTYTPSSLQAHLPSSESPHPYAFTPPHRYTSSTPPNSTHLCFQICTNYHTPDPENIHAVMLSYCLRFYVCLLVVCLLHPIFPYLRVAISRACFQRHGFPYTHITPTTYS